MQIMDYYYIQRQYERMDKRPLSDRYLDSFGWATKLRDDGTDRCLEIFKIMEKREGGRI